jgi:cytochrome c peroxidase
LIAVLLAACEATPPLTPEEWARIESLSPVPPLPARPDNPVADDEAAAELGRALFFDARLSPSGVACASCHDPAREYADGRPTSRARGVLPRNAPSLRGSAWMRWQTWDGRRDSVLAQSLAPLEDPREHGGSRTRVARVVALQHEEAYTRVFGPLPEALAPTELPADARPAEPDHPHARAWAELAPQQRAAVDRVFVHAGQALEAYVRRLHPGEAPLDRYVAALRAGDPEGGGHLEPAAARGLRAFVGPAGCFHCHHGPLLSDGEFHRLPRPAAIGAPTRDRGRAEGALAVLADPFRCGGPYRAEAECPELRHLDPSLPMLEGAFRTPSLRNVARTAPYLHAGQLAQLEDVLDLYAAPHLDGRRDPLLRPLPRSVSRADLLAFLAALGGDPLPARWSTPARSLAGGTVRGPADGMPTE